MLKAFKNILISALVTAWVANAAGISGTVKSGGGGGAPLAGAKVVLVAFNGNNGGVHADSTLSNAQGVYSFDSVQTGFYQVQASLVGYQNGSNLANVTKPNQKLVVDITLNKNGGGGAGTGTVIGIVHDASTLAAIANATVILGHRSGGGASTSLDTAKTDAQGRFVFDSVAALNGYVVTAMASGYVTQSANVDVAARDTARVQLNLVKQPTPNSKIMGKVTDADSNKAVTGAKVVLRRRAGATFPAVWESIDSMTTGADGAFAFDSLPASVTGSPYDIVVTKADFEDVVSANIQVGQNQTETVNVKLVKIAKGSMATFVGQDTTAHPPLAGATVTAVLQGQDGVEYTGLTDAKGWVSFPSVISGSYLVTVSLNGYLAKNTQRTVQADEKDTGLVFLTRATAANSKSLSGLVRDASGKAVDGADVVFESNGAGMNHITLHTTSSATGDYSFAGLPTGVTGGTVTVQADGFAQFTGNVSLASAANFLNVTLQKAAVGVRMARASATSLRMLAGPGETAQLEFPAAPRAGRILIYDGRGSLLGAVPVAAGTTRVSLPQGIGIGRDLRFAVLEQGGTSLSLRLSPLR
jgi:hypothetical protein